MTVARKQVLLRRHRQRKRLAVLALLGVLLLLSLQFGWWLLPLGLALSWLLHEALFADHLFYSPRSDYRHRFPAATASVELDLSAGRIDSAALPAALQLAAQPDSRSRCAQPPVRLLVRSRGRGR